MSGRKRTEFGDKVMEANILDMMKEPGDGFESVMIQAAENEQKRLMTYEEAGHCLVEVSDEVRAEVKKWIEN